jgi:type VI secretion system protein ImpC
MADPKSQQDAQAEAGTVEATEFDSLLRKEFKPKTDEAKEAVEKAVRTLAEQALSQTKLISNDVVKSIEAMIAQLDKKLTEQINLILHHQDFQKLEGAWRGLSYLVNNTETDEMLKIRFMNISKADLGKTLKRLGPEPVVQEDLRGGIRPVRRRAVRLSGGRLSLRPDPARR